MSQKWKTKKVGIHKIAPNLYVKVRPSGVSSWLYIKTVNGKRKELVLGDTKNLSLKDVKQLIPTLHTGLTNTIIVKEPEKKQTVKLTVRKLIKEALPVIQNRKKWRNKKHADQWRNTLNTYAIPRIGSKAVEDITRNDILKVLESIWETKTETAFRLRGRLESIFGYAIAKGYYSGSNPCIWKGNLEYFLPPVEKILNRKHFEALSYKETVEFCEYLRNMDTIASKAILFGILTAARVNEFILAQWIEIDFENKVWNCPPSRRKDSKPYPHRVPLSTQAIEILRSIHHNSSYIFASKMKEGAISLETPRIIIKRRYGKGTMHGFRSTFRDWCAENHVDRVLAEKSLMHVIGSATEQAYQRSDLLEQRRELMQLWANAILPNGYTK